MRRKSIQNKENRTVLNVLEEIEGIARKDSLPSIGPIKAKIVENVIKEHKPKKLLEIGTLHGYSAILAAIAISIYSYENKNIDSDANYSKPIVISVEKDEKLATIARNNIESSRLSKLIKVISGDAIRVIPNLNTKFNMIFLDAAKNEYLRYLQLIEEYGLLDKRAVIVADNAILFEIEMEDYLDYVRHSGKYQSYTTETCLEFSKKVLDALEVSVSLV